MDAKRGGTQDLDERSVWTEVVKFLLILIMAVLFFFLAQSMVHHHFFTGGAQNSGNAPIGP